MTAATRILKADTHNAAARPVRLADFSHATQARFETADFEPIKLFAETAHRPAPAAASRVEPLVSALQTATNQLRAQRDIWLDQCQRETIRLGIAIAERLLRRTLVTQPEAVIDLVHTALECSVGAERLHIRLHPDDAELLATASQTHPLDARHIDFVPDESLTRGDCVVETPNGQIDARQQVLLQRIADELLAE